MAPRLKFTMGSVEQESASQSEKWTAESKKKKRGSKKPPSEEQEEVQEKTGKGKRKGAEEAGGEKKKQKKQEVAIVPEEETELPPAFMKVASPQASKTATDMTPLAGAQTLRKLQRSFLDTSVREQLRAYVPSDLKLVKPDGIVEVPLGYIDIQDLTVKGTKITFNPRQINKEGVDRIRTRFRINGFDADRSILTGVLTYEGKQFPMRKSHMDTWDEVEKDICESWKAALIATADKNKTSAYLVNRVAGQKGSSGFLIKAGDGRHRVQAMREEQEASYHTFDLDPLKTRHPMVKVQLLNMWETERGRLVQLMNTNNEQVSRGVQEDTLPLKIMTVRRTLKNLTEKQVSDFPPDLMEALRVMSAKKLQIEYTTYKPIQSHTIKKIPKLLVALMVDREFEEDVSSWKVADDPPKNIAFYTLCNEKQTEMRRLITAANIPAGSGYEKALEDLTKDPEVANGLGKEDLYALVGTGLNDDWVETAMRTILVKKPSVAEEEGWPRGQLALREVCKGLGFVYEVTGEGMLWLRELGVLSAGAKMKDGSVDLTMSFATTPMKTAFRVKGFVGYPQWVKLVVFGKEKKGEYLKRYMFAQAQECRVKATAKGKSIDVEEAGKRSVCQYLLWLFPPAENWSDLKTLYGNVPEEGGLRAKVVETVKKGNVFGKKWDEETAGSSGYVLEDERAMGLPVERDCGGSVPGAFTNLLGPQLQRKYIPRKERAERLGFVAQEPVKEDEGGKERVVFNEADVYNIVSEGDSFDCPTIEAVEKGLEDLWMLEEGDWKAKEKGVDVVWVNVPLPRVVVEEEEVGKYDLKKERTWESNRLVEALNMAKDLLTSAGILVVVAPVGFPSELLTNFSLGATAVAAEVRSVVTLMYEAKKAKAAAKVLYGAFGNTLLVYFCTPMGSQKESVIPGSAWKDALEGVAFLNVTKKHGSHRVFTLSDWEEAGKGLSRKAVQSLAGGLMPRGGTAVVLNAKGGREVSVLSKAGMKVLAAYSENKASFPGKLADSRNGKVYGAVTERKAPDWETRKLVHEARVEAGVEESVEKGVEEGPKGAEEEAPGDSEKGTGEETGMLGEKMKQREGLQAEGDIALPVEAPEEFEGLGTWDEEEEVAAEGGTAMAGVARGAGMEGGTRKKERKPLPDFVTPEAMEEAFGLEMEKDGGTMGEDTIPAVEEEVDTWGDEEEEEKQESGGLGYTVEEPTDGEEEMGRGKSRSKKTDSAKEVDEDVEAYLGAQRARKAAAEKSAMEAATRVKEKEEMVGFMSAKLMEEAEGGMRKGESAQQVKPGEGKTAAMEAQQGETEVGVGGAEADKKKKAGRATREASALAGESSGLGTGKVDAETAAKNLKELVKAQREHNEAQRRRKGRK